MVEQKHFQEMLNHYNKLNEDENQRHIDTLEKIQNDYSKRDTQKKLEIITENKKHQKTITSIWDEMYVTMNESQKKQLTTWMTLLLDTEMYGGKISDENQKMVDIILKSFNQLSDNSKEAMGETMKGMLQGMQEQEPSLYAKATGIASGILSRLKKTFDIHSPSKETRKIFENVMKGSELGLEDEEKALYDKANEIANNMKTRLTDITPNIGSIKQSVIDQTRTVFTTPNIVINAQDELTPAKINIIIDAVNRRLGSQY